MSDDPSSSSAVNTPAPSTDQAAQSKPKKRWRKLKITGLILLVMVLGLLGLWLWITRPAPPLVFSKETTYITKPLKPNGYPDYAAYLNQIYSKGVTPENNALIPLIKAIGAGHFYEDINLANAFEKLGLSKSEAAHLPAPAFIEAEKYTKQVFPETSSKPKLELEEDEVILKNAPSSPAEQLIEMLYDFGGPVKDWPEDGREHIEAWVKQNDKAIELFHQAAERSRFFSPVVYGKDNSDDALSSSLLHALLPKLNAIRHLAQATCARGDLRLEAGDIQGAWDDFLACKRLGRLMLDEKYLIGILVARTIDEIPNKSILNLLADKNLTAEQIKQFQADLNAIPPVKQWGHWTLSERLFGLSVTVELIAGIKDREAAKRTMKEMLGKNISMPSSSVDFNVTLKRINKNYDYIEAPLREPWSKTPIKNPIPDEVDKRFKEIEESGAFKVALEQMFASPQERGRFFADVLLTVLMPATNFAKGLEIRRRLNNDFIKTAMALRLYQMKHGSYPDSLEVLVAAYLKTIPKDLFDPTGGPIKYRKTKDGFILYSNGDDEKDDGGNFSLDEYGEKNDDDYGMEFPPKPEPVFEDKNDEDRDEE